MIGTNGSWRTDAALRSSMELRKSDVSPVSGGTSLSGRRSVIASAEPEDAHLTGMTRSLDRRLLALNLKPAASAPYSAASQVLKVA